MNRSHLALIPLAFGLFAAIASSGATSSTGSEARDEDQILEGEDHLSIVVQAVANFDDQDGKADLDFSLALESLEFTGGDAEPSVTLKVWEDDAVLLEQALTIPLVGQVGEQTTVSCDKVARCEAELELELVLDAPLEAGQTLDVGWVGDASVHYTSANADVDVGRVE